MSDTVVQVIESSTVVQVVVGQALVETGGGGGITDGDKGGIIVSGTGAVWTVKAGSITDLMLGASAIALFAAASHSHTIANITGLQAALDGKAPSAHGHVAADVSDFAATVRGATLTGYAAAGSRVALAAGDTVLGAFGKIGKWLADLAAVAFSGSASDLTAGTLPAARFDDTAHGARAGGTLHPAATTGVAGFMSAADKTKMDGVAPGATANSADAVLLARANHTGTQPAASITGLAAVATSGSAADLSTGTLPDARLSNAAGNTGSFGLAGSVAQIVIDAKGRITSAVNTAISIASAAISDFAAAVRGQVESELVAGTNVTITPSGSGATRQLTIAAAGGGGGATDATVISDTSTGTVNDWNPAGMGATGPVIINWTGAGSVLINGLANGADGRHVTIHNNGAHIMVLKLEGLPATAANRFERIPIDRSPVFILPGDQLEIEYLSSLSRWAMVGDPEGGPRSRWRYFRISPVSGTSSSTEAINASSNGGTVGHAVPAATNQKTSKYRHTYSTGATAGTQAGVRTSSQFAWRGNAVDLGGIFAEFSWGFDTLPASAESWFVGLQGSAAALGNVDVSTVLNTVGWGRDSADSAQIRAMNNDGTGAATKVDLGASFPENTTVEYGGAIWAAPNGAGFSTVIWRKDDLTVAPIVTDLTTDIPANTVFLQGIVSVCNRAAAAAYVLSSTNALKAWSN